MDEQVRLLKALADPTRLKLLKLILAEENCVCELREILQISQPAVSQHIVKLRAAGLISERSSGLWTYYRADPDRLRSALEELTRFLEADPATVPAMALETQRRQALNRAEICEEKQ